MGQQPAKTSHEEPKKLRILSLDGAGIYGLTQALWLRQLCDEDPDFLAPGSIDLFAGCSAGAINSLLLAKAKNPRDVVLGGELERFWQQPGAFTNSNPVAAWLSLFGIGALAGGEDLLRQLRQYFGDLKLHDLHHKVLISTFNWYKSRADYPGPNFPDDGCGSGKPWGPGDSWDPWQWLAGFWGFTPDLAASRGRGGGSSFAERLWTPFDSGQLGDYDSWGPNFFTNLPLTPSAIKKTTEHWSVVDIAYGAASPPGLRAIRGGLSDGAQFGASPVLNGIGAMIEFIGKKEGKKPAEILPRIAALSLGTGSRQPYYWLENFNFSSLQFGMMPTNPWCGHWSPPTAAVFLDAPVDDTILVTEQILDTSFFRLSPGILQMGTFDASRLASFPYGQQQWVVDQIRHAVHTENSTKSVKNAVKFLQNHWERPANAEST